MSTFNKNAVAGNNEGKGRIDLEPAAKASSLGRTACGTLLEANVEFWVVEKRERLAVRFLQERGFIVYKKNSGLAVVK